MDKRLELKDFDAMGIIRLTDVEGIRDYVTPILNENGETITKALTAGTDDTSRWLQR